MHIEHINISIPFELLGAVKGFYGEVFGLQEGFRPSFTRRGYWLCEKENALIHLTESRVQLPVGSSCYLDHIAFQLTGLNRFRERLENEH